MKKLKTAGIIFVSVVMAMMLAYYLGTKVLILSTSNAFINIDKEVVSAVEVKDGVSQDAIINYYRIGIFDILEYEKQGVVKMQRVDPTGNIVFVANPEKIEQQIPDKNNDPLNTNTTDTTVPILDTNNDKLNTNTTVPIPDTPSNDTAQTDKDKWVPYIIEQSKKHGLPPEWILAMIDFSGSKYNPKYKLYNSDGSYLAGVTGVLSRLIPEMAQKSGLEYKEGMEFDAETNIIMVVQYLAEAYIKHPDLQYVAAVFQNGFERADKLVENNSLNEFNSDYVKLVKERADEWKEVIYK